jgi:ABC-type phosphate transport system auxiliary subunit
MPTPFPKHANALLLLLLNSLADFDGHVSEDAARLLDELRERSEVIPPLYADVFRLPIVATCADLVNRIESLSQQQVAIASYAFQIFRSYEQMLRVNTNVTSQQQAAYESQLERIRSLVVKTRSALHEALSDV